MGPSQSEAASQGFKHGSPYSADTAGAISQGRQEMPDRRATPGKSESKTRENFEALANVRTRARPAFDPPADKDPRLRRSQHLQRSNGVARKKPSDGYYDA
jgi:hypothetical protein